MRIVRSSFVAAFLAAALSVAAPPVQSAPVVSLPDTSGLLTPWRVEPSSPCQQDSIFMIVRGFVATPCDSFLGAEAIDPLRVRIRTQTYANRRCFAAPSVFFPVPIALGRFAPGNYGGVVEVVTVSVLREDSTSVAVQEVPFDFVVSFDCPTPPPPPASPLPYVNTIGTLPDHPCAGKPTSMVMAGEFFDGCGEVTEAVVHDPQHVELTLRLHALGQLGCAREMKPWQQLFDLGPLPSGPHQVLITLHVDDVDSTRTRMVRSTSYGSHGFFVFGDCDTLPVPVPGPLPYVTDIFVGKGPCELGPPCPKDSAMVWVTGVFPSDCFSFKRFELIPSPILVFPPPPPTVRIIVDATGCTRRPCLDVQVPWSAMVKLPPLAAHAYDLRVELARVSCSDSFPPGELFRTNVPFAVQESCAVEPACLETDFAPGPGNVTACNATITPTQPAQLTLLVRPTVALAGLQGSFRLEPPGLKITHVERIGPALDMLLEWSATNNGARFVLVAQRGAPIPAIPASAPGAPRPSGWAVLRVTVEGAAAGIPDDTYLYSENELGSDIDGKAVGLCLPLPCIDGSVGPPGAIDPRLGARRALICAERACDFNADGLQDVRDLVTMVHCVTGEGMCPPDVGTKFDCNADRIFSLPDVMCCARTILLLAPCRACPPDTGHVRPEPGVALSFGKPSETPGGVDLPLRISGADRLGAAMLTFAVPLDRYELSGLGGDATGRWLKLHEVRDHRVVLGLVATWSGDFATDPNLDLTLHLRLKPGETPGGEVSAVTGDFSGADGVRLAVDLGHQWRELPGPSRLMLGGSHPNPFSAETRFTLELTEGADVVVGIYDLRGRLVANLFRGRLPSGAREFRWDGRRTDGSVAPEGVYFYQTTVGGKTLARKLILLRGD